LYPRKSLKYTTSSKMQDRRTVSHFRQWIDQRALIAHTRGVCLLLFITKCFSISLLESK